MQKKERETLKGEWALSRFKLRAHVMENRKRRTYQKGKGHWLGKKRCKCQNKKGNIIRG